MRTKTLVIVASFGVVSAIAAYVYAPRTLAVTADAGMGCCLLPDGCADDIEANDCVAQGGIWSTSGACESGITCDPGACCFPAGGCIDNLTEWWCIQYAGGVFAGSNVLCIDEPTCVAGACCRPEGICEVVTKGHCEENFGGIYRGDGTDCADFNNNGIADTCESIPATCRSDSNEDGIVDIIDFLTLLQDWGPCE